MTASMSTPVLVAIIAASTIGVAVVAALFVLRVRRRRRKVKMLTPGQSTVFRGVSSTTAMDQSSCFLQSSQVTTATTSPQSMDMQTVRMPRELERGSEAVGRSTIDISHASTLPVPPSETPAASDRAPSMASGRSVFSASLLLRGGLRNSLPSLSLFRASWRTSQQRTTSTRPGFHATTIGSHASNTGAPLSIMDLQRHTEGAAWRDPSDTCWSIGPDEVDSDTELESGARFLRTTVGSVEGDNLPPRSRLSTVSDDTNSMAESTPRRVRRGFSSLDDSPRRARGISELDDSSPRRIRNLSQLEEGYSQRERGDSSLIDIDTNTSGASYFSADSDYYDETIKDCSSVLFDSDSDDDNEDHDKRALEHEL